MSFPTSPKTNLEADAKSCTGFCFICGGKLIEKKLKSFCIQCGTLCQTCCDTEVGA